MLLRMFGRFAERSGYSVEIPDYSPVDEAGVKSVTLDIKGHNAIWILEIGKRRAPYLCEFPLRFQCPQAHILRGIDVMPEIDDAVEVNINQADLKSRYISSQRSRRPAYQ
jgi:peptide chain release factor 2